jgi:class 3 adenylate cyclase/ABC-type oligopeptide transport system substrate-binding subunit
MSPQRSSGIATVMFTDVEASTDMTTRLGDDAAAPVFAAHDRIVRDQVAAHGGRHVRSTGDGFVVLFDSARSAVACALSIQGDLAGHEDGIRVRIGLNAGEVIEGDGELFGAAVNLAARVMDRAGGGEVLVTDTVRQLAGTVPDARFRERGRVALKGFPERQRLHEVRPAGARPPPRSRRRKKRRRQALAAAALAIGAVALVAVLATTGGEGGAAPVLPNSVAILDPGDGRVLAQVPVGLRPADLAVGAGSVWVANLADNTVTQIGARSRRFAGTISPGISVDGLAAGPSGVWVADSARAVARVIDPAFHSVARSLPIGAEGSGFATQAVRPVAVTADAVWITYGYAEIARLDPDTRRVVATIPVGNAPSGLAVGAGAVWVSDSTDGTVTRIDSRTNESVETIAVGESASGIAVGAGGVWVAVPLEDRVKRIDPASNAVTDTVRIAGGPAGIAVGAGAVWVTNRRGGTVARIDPDAARVTRTVRLGHSPQGIAVVNGAVWVALQASPAPAGSAPVAQAADAATVLRPQGMKGGTDPPVSFGGEEVLYATCALLLNYPDRPAPAGAQLQPEVARAMPTVSDHGRTYTFRLRPGFRFSPPSNAPVTAEAFRRAIERALHPRTQSYAPVFMSDIVGFPAYHARKAKHLAGVTARGDTLTIRLKAPSTTLPARLASPNFCAVPPTTPISAKGIDQIPMAGPYYLASYVPKRRLVLRRNPNYGGTRPARLREIDIDLDVAPARAVAAVQAGRADYASAVPVDRVPTLDQRYGIHSAVARAGRQRYFSGTEPNLHFFALNTRRPLFASTRMRQAVNAALDRRALARSVPFSPSPAGAPGRPTDQFTPPGLPGFRDATIYPLGGPDLENARRLVGTRKRRAVLYTCNLPPCLEHGRVVRRNLAAIGLDVEVKNFSLDQMFRRIQRPGEPWDIGYYNFFMDFPDASDFVATLFTPFGEGDPNVGHFRDKKITRGMRAAGRLTDAARARAFARLDANLARAGAAAPFATGVTTDFFSDRIGCQVHQPIYGISLGALCLRH